MTQVEMLHDELFGSTVNGTDGREAYPKRWVAALVQVFSINKNQASHGRPLILTRDLFDGPLR